MYIYIYKWCIYRYIYTIFLSLYRYLPIYIHYLPIYLSFFSYLSIYLASSLSIDLSICTFIIWKFQDNICGIKHPWGKGLKKISRRVLSQTLISTAHAP